MAGANLPPEIPRTTKKGGFPWLYAGCGCFIVVIVLFALIGFGLYRTIHGLVEQYTDTTSVELPPSTLPEDAYAALQTRLKAFTDALDHNEATAPLILTADEINALIERDPRWSAAKGHVHVEIQGDKLSGQVSMPLDMFALPGRYLNGSASLSIFMRSGVLYVNLESLEVKGKTVPEPVIAQWRTQNLAQNFNRDPQYKDFREKISNIEIANDTIRIEAKTGAPK